MSNKGNLWETWRQLKARVAENSNNEAASKAKQEYSSIACSQCGGKRVYSNVTLSDGSNLIARRVGAGIFKWTGILTVICTDCGLIAFYAEDPKALVSKPLDK